MRSSRSRMIALGILAAALVAYVLARPAIGARFPYLHLAEYPAATLVVGAVLWAALRPPPEERRQAAPSESEWRRHEQKVRPLPDPEVARLQGALAAWRDGGSRADEAADVLAAAQAADEEERSRLRAQHAEEMSRIASPRRREAYLRREADRRPDTRGA